MPFDCGDDDLNAFLMNDAKAFMQKKIANTFLLTDDDDSDWWTLQGFKIGRKPTQPGVYIHHGKKVTIKRVK